MKRILAIDPGNEVSGWVKYDLELGRPVAHGNATPNEELVRIVKQTSTRSSVLIVEMFKPRGQPLYIQLVWTAVWIGRFVQAWGGRWDHLYRETVKHHLTGRTNSKDANVNVAVRERWGGRKSVGKKDSPGPLYGIAKHAWPALAVAVAYAEGARSEEPKPPTVRSRSGPPGDEPALGSAKPSEPPMGDEGRPVRRIRSHGPRRDGEGDRRSD